MNNHFQQVPHTLTDDDIRETEQTILNYQTILRLFRHLFSKGVLFLGLTGSGKSSLVASLCGKELTVQPSNFLNVPPTLDCPNSGIVHGPRSGTECPQLFNVEELGLVLCDCPGFDNTESPKQEIVNAFAINEIMVARQEDIKIQILLVVSAPELFVQRSFAILERIERIKQMFPQNPNLVQTIGLVITKMDPRISAQDFINPNTNPQINPLIYQYFHDHVFSFPYPLSNTGVYTDFHDKGRLIQFLQTDAFYLQNPIHHIIVNQESINILQRNKTNQLNIIIPSVSQFFLNTSDECQHLKSHQIDTMLAFLHHIHDQEQNIQNIEDFFALIQANPIPFHPEHFEDILNRIHLAHPFCAFLTKVLETNEIVSAFKDQIHISLEREIQNIGILLEQTRERERIEKMNTLRGLLLNIQVSDKTPILVTAATIEQLDILERHDTVHELYQRFLPFASLFGRADLDVVATPQDLQAIEEYLDRIIVKMPDFPTELPAPGAINRDNGGGYVYATPETYAVEIGRIRDTLTNLPPFFKTRFSVWIESVNQRINSVENQTSLINTVEMRMITPYRGMKVYIGRRGHLELAEWEADQWYDTCVAQLRNESKQRHTVLQTILQEPEIAQILREVQEVIFPSVSFNHLVDQANRFYAEGNFNPPQ